LLELNAIDLPTYNPDKEPMDHTGLRDATEAVNWADAFLLASPDYHGLMSGAMKNFLDFYWSEFAGKLFAYVVYGALIRGQFQRDLADGVTETFAARYRT
jgi:FMN reductase